MIIMTMDATVIQGGHSGGHGGHSGGGHSGGHV
ncbi:hypothetical protein A2U01_0099493, partial [Trifolium medium]|nr:hypothetical protein [Trifolium medium]